MKTIILFGYNYINETVKPITNLQQFVEFINYLKNRINITNGVIEYLVMQPLFSKGSEIPMMKSVQLMKNYQKIASSNTCIINKIIATDSII